MLRIGHRGAPKVAPQNTLASFRAAFDMGCDWVECDCQPSLDGVVVLAHDPDVVDIEGRRYAVAEHSAELLASLNLGAGEGVPTFAQLVELANGRGGVMADIKVAGFEEQIVTELAPLPYELKLISGAGDAGRAVFRTLDPRLAISVTVDARHEAELVQRWGEIDTEGVTLEYPLITPERVADLHRRSVKIYAWTVDDLPTMRSLAAMGVDALISNRPELLKEI